MSPCCDNLDRCRIGLLLHGLFALKGQGHRDSAMVGDGVTCCMVVV
jgi:hypothetical protein